MVIYGRAADHIGSCISTHQSDHLYLWKTCPPVSSILRQRGSWQKRCLGLLKDEEDMKTSRAVGAILAVLALPILRQLYHPTVNVNSTILGTEQDVTVNVSTTSKNKDVQDQWSAETNTQAEIKVEADAEAKFEEYSFHEGCPCRRTAPTLSQLERHFNASTVEQARRSSRPWKPAYGSYVGNSTCNRHSSCILCISISLR